MSKLVKQSLADQIYKELKKSIIMQEINWGERLNVSELQQKYEVSSTPIREALNRLQKEGLVEYKTNFGAKVIDLSEKDIVEINEVALGLDCAAIKYAMKTGKLQEIGAELSKSIQAYKEAKTEQEQANYTEEFVHVFYRYADNDRLIYLSHAIKDQQRMLKSSFAKILDKPSGKKKAYGMEDQSRIYEAVLAGELQNAVMALENNYSKATESLIQQFRR